MTFPKWLFRLTNVVLNLWGWMFVSYHYVYWWKASQQVGGGQQRWHKGVPNNGTGSEGNESLALGAQRLEALWVADVRPVVSCGHVGGCSQRYVALGSPHCWCGWSRPWRARGLQERRDPVGGTLGEIAEQHGRVSSEGADRVTPHGRMHRPPVCPWQIWWDMNNSSFIGCFQVGSSPAFQTSNQDYYSLQMVAVRIRARELCDLLANVFSFFVLFPVSAAWFLSYKAFKSPSLRCETSPTCISIDALCENA